MIEPLAVAVHITRQAGITPGQSVVVMGAGPVGLLCAAVARAHGATTVVSVDIIPAKLALAKEFAATHTYLSQRVSPEENARTLLEAAGLPPTGADAVIDASGAEPSIQTSLHVVRAGGTYVQGGMGRADITFPIMALCIKEVTAKGSFRYGSGDYKLAIQLVASGQIDVRRLVSEVVRFDQAEEAFKKVKEGQVIKILIAGPNEKIDDAAPDAAAATATEPEAAAVEQPPAKEETPAPEPAPEPVVASGGEPEPAPSSTPLIVAEVQSPTDGSQTATRDNDKTAAAAPQ